MPTVRKSVIVPHRPDTMFDLVDDVERYPEFLPWCPRTELLERTGETTRARLHIDYHGLRTTIATQNLNVRPDRMELGFLEGPFEHFHATWQFFALGDIGCRVQFDIEYEFSSGALEKVMGAVFGRIAETLVDRFVERARRLEGAG